MTSTDILFKPFSLKSLSLPNRIVMAPMTRSRSPEQIPGDTVAAYYRARAEGGTGLILTEGTAPEHKSATNDVNVPHFHGAESLKGWGKVVKAVKSAGGHIMPQLWHQGVVRHPGTGPYPEQPSMSPSGLAKKDKKVAEPMSDGDVADVIAGFASSARYAKELGFDGVELHGAHGYLIDQFFWEGTNARDDKYGGTLAQRANFAADIARAVRREVGADFPILLRFSQWKQQDFAARLAHTPAELESFLRPLADAGVDIFHCSTRRFWEPEFPELNSDLNLAGWTKKLCGLPTISVGSVSLNMDFITAFRQAGAEISGIDRLIEMMERGDFDLIAVGRALISNPDWANKVRAGKLAELTPYTPEALATLV
ncbi:MAG TPA: NADH:flavin oxidoreductase [Rhizomicrobium sp.]|jgi:2,4-dienoyl-CoA reductase-like NADH-dependent reductase (Old Yellow Enzyme family)|nr:NADH:flavin oxidoreductase [Rhizomicrobium sp.]